jgi:hypothetical protein
LSVSQGRSVFRVVELLRLVELVDLTTRSDADEC